MKIRSIPLVLTLMAGLFTASAMAGNKPEDRVKMRQGFMQLQSFFKAQLTQQAKAGQLDEQSRDLGTAR